MKRRVDLPRTSLRERRRKRRILLACLGVAAVVVVVAAVAGSTWLPFVRIQAIDVEGQKTVLPQAVQQVAQNELYGGYLHLFARSNIFIYPRGLIEQRLLTQFPMFQSVEVHAENFHTIGVTVTERQPVALWCGSSVSTSSSCFLVDQGGMVYAPALVYSGDAYQKFYGAVTVGALPQQFLSPEEFHSLSTFVDTLARSLGSTVGSVMVDQDRDARVIFANGFVLLFSLDQNDGDVSDHLGLALRSSVFATHPLIDFQYLDLRFGDKLYYKLKSTAVASSSKQEIATSSVHT